MLPITPFAFDITDEEIEEFTRESAKILRSGILILGEYSLRFEEAFAEFVGVKHAIAVNSGTSALEILLRLKDVTDKTVLVPTNTNFATAAAVLRAGGQVRYLDMDRATFAPTLAMVREAVEQPRRSSQVPVIGVLWVHIGGVISPEFPAVVAYCRDQGLFILGDAAHAHGSQLGGVKSGNLADAGAFSFFPTKIMTTCEGGMITTNSDEEDYLARSFRNQGKRGMNYGSLHHDLGNSWRMTEMNALLGLMQLKKLPDVLQKRQAMYQIITKALDEAGLHHVSTRHMDTASLYKLIVTLPAGRGVDDVKAALANDGVLLGGAVYDLPCHRQPVFKGMCAGESYPGADRWCPNHICPPLTATMTAQQAEYVGTTLVKYLS
jgi:perosamine synthetase